MSGPDISLCPNCGQPGAHFVPPSMGDKGFFACAVLAPVSVTPPAATDTPSKILHCENCGDSYYDSGFSVGCPWCKLAASQKRCAELEKWHVSNWTCTHHSDKEREDNKPCCPVCARRELVELREAGKRKDDALRTIKNLLIGADMDGTQWFVLPRIPINVCAQIDLALGEIGPALNKEPRK